MSERVRCLFNEWKVSCYLRSRHTRGRVAAISSCDISVFMLHGIQRFKFMLHEAVTKWPKFSESHCCCKLHALQNRSEPIKNNKNSSFICPYNMPPRQWTRRCMCQLHVPVPCPLVHPDL